MWIVIIVGVVVIFIIALIVGINNSNEAIARTNTFLDDLENFTPTQSLSNNSETAGIALDELKKEICLWTYSVDFKERRLSYDDILSVEIIQDNISIIQTNRISQLGGALVGGVLLGGLGAAVGALSGKKQTSDGKINKLAFILKINDTTNPIFTISKIDTETSTEGFIYKKDRKQLDHWHGVFEAIIKQADIEYQNSNNTSVQIAVLSVSDELKKLAELKESGILTEEEFTIEKVKLLNRS